MRIRSLTLWCLAFLSVACDPSRAPAEDHYYMVIFGSQGQPNLPRLSHTFATFVKTSGEGNPQKGAIEVHTISWLPGTLVVEPVRLQPEAGKNLDLAASLTYATKLDTQVSCWGPFAIKKELFDRAVKQIEVLNSGKIAYIALDRRFRGQGASNCIHAVSDMDVDKGFLDTGTAHGKAASQEVVGHLRGWMIPSTEDLRFLLDRLGIPKAVDRMPPLRSVAAQ